MADQISFTPREWYDLWNVAKYRYAEGEENYWSTRNKITKQLITAQDAKFREAREKALLIEQRKRDRVKQKKQKIEDHYREYIRNALAQERAEKQNKATGKKVVLVDAREKRYPNIHTIHHHHYSFSLDPTDSSDENAHSQYYSSGMPAFKSSVGDISEGVEGSEIGEDNDGAHQKDRRDTHTPDLRPEEGTHIHWDPTSYESNSKYTNIITNRALPEHIKSILSRTFGPFLANYYINPHAPAIRVREKPRVDLQKLPQEQRGARLIWRNLRTESNRGVENFGERIITQEASKTFKAYVDEVKHTDMAIPKLFHPLSKAQEKKQIEETEIDVANLVRSEERYASRTKTASMSQLMSVANADKSQVLAHNNQANQSSLAVSLEVTEPVDYIPLIETIREQEDGEFDGHCGDEGIVKKKSPAPDEKRSGQTLNANMMQQLGASWLKFLTEQESSNVRPKFSKKYAYAAEVNPVKHVKREATLPSSSFLIEADFVPERIDLSRLARNDDKYLACLRGAIEEREKSVNFAPSTMSKSAPVKPDNEVVENPPWLPKSTGPGGHCVNQWAPLSLTALSEYSSVGKSHLNTDSGVNYLDSFQIQHSHDLHP